MARPSGSKTRHDNLEHMFKVVSLPLVNDAQAMCRGCCKWFSAGDLGDRLCVRCYDGARLPRYEKKFPLPES